MLAAGGVSAWNQAGKVGMSREAKQLTNLRTSTAKQYYEQAGVRQEHIASHMEGIDFSQPVRVEVLPEGASVVQYQIPGRPIGGYFAPLGTPAEAIGINPLGRLPMAYKTTSNVSVLRSFAADTSANTNIPSLVRGTGGGIQYFTSNRSLFKVIK